MERTPVKSSNIASVGYEKPTKTLEVKFNSGGIYQYSGVEPKTYTDLMGAKSKGRFVQKNIVQGGFKVKKMDPEKKE